MVKNVARIGIAVVLILILGIGFVLAGSFHQGAAASPTPGLDTAPVNGVFLPMVRSFFIPTATRTPTPDPVKPTGTPTQQTVAVTMTHFAIGPGGSDVIPRQIVRTVDDRLYVFGYRGDQSSQLVAYWTTAPGLPGTSSAFNGTLSITDSANILSVDLVYDGGSIIHVFSNTIDRQVKVRPFDIRTNTFKTARVLDTSGGTVSGYYVGTSGLSAMASQDGILHLAYWTSSNHIVYRSYTYNAAADTYSLVSGPTQLDSAGSANHPVLAVSPLDGSITVAWIQEPKPAKILARTFSGGRWGAQEQVSAAAVWISTSSGINIDNGPSLLIGPDGMRHLAYIEDWQIIAPFDYGKVRYATKTGSAGWVDQYTGFYAHNPALAINSSGKIFIIGHGYEFNHACTSMDDMCVYPKNPNGTWGPPLLLAAHQAGESFDSSPSVKWSVLGYHRPETIELIFPDAGPGYANSILHYGRIP